jgi:hypothetical protein
MDDDLLTIYIKEHLPKFIKNSDDGFLQIYSSLISEKKNEFKELLIYIDKLLNRTVNQNDRKIKLVHFHFEGIQTEVIKLLSEFITVKFFLTGLYSDGLKSDTNHLQDKIKQLNRVLEQPIQVTTGATGKSWEYKQKKYIKSKLKEKKRFYEDICNYNPNASLFPQTLINVTKLDYEYLKGLFEYKPFAVPLKSVKKELSYVLLNDDETIDEVDQIRMNDMRALLDEIENIILFNCEMKPIFHKFNFKELNEWNDVFCKFKNLIIFSFNKGQFRLSKLRSKLISIQSTYYSGVSNFNNLAYVIMPYELNLLLDQSITKKIVTDFYGDTYCSFWEGFKLNVHKGISELVSIKMMNVYSLVISPDIKELVLKDIFGFNGVPMIISIETKEAINDLSVDTIKNLRSYLSDTLDWIIHSDWKQYLKSIIGTSSNILVPKTIYNNAPLLKSFCHALNITDNRVRTWVNIEKSTETDILILDYRDTGELPYTITPNIFEDHFARAQNVKALFISIFFKNRYDRLNYLLNKEKIKILDHPIRDRVFKWEELRKISDEAIPFIKEDISWDYENNYQISYELSSIKITFKYSNKVKSYYPSELLIVTTNNSGSFRAIRAEDLLEEEFDEVEIFIQQLEDIYSEFNIYEKLANTARERKELQIIRNKYNLNESEAASRLWKILLNRKCNQIGTHVLFEKIKEYMVQKNMDMVSYNTFKKIWIEPNSASIIPREKSMFFVVCEFLDLPISYYRIMLRLKNAEKQTNSVSSRQMNSLLSDLINDGCFNINVNLREKLIQLKNKYIQNHEFDEIGIGDEEVVDELFALVDLLKPYFSLKQIIKVQRVS